MKKQVLLHVGMPKTGSTALQQYLFEHKKNLEDKGVGFFLPTIRRTWREQMANASFITEASVLGMEKLDWFAQERESFRKYAERFDRFIFSDELLWDFSFKKNDFWTIVKGVLFDLFGEEVAVCPIVYLRRQDEWAFSWWKESVRVARPTCDLFPEFLSGIERLGMLCYDQWLEKIESTFGIEHAIVRIYEGIESKCAGIFYDFLSVVGIEERKWPVCEKQKINESITIDAAHAMLLINKGVVPFERTGVSSMWAIHEASSIFSRMFPDNRIVYPLKMEERIALIDRCTESYQKIAKRYFGGVELFSKVIQPYSTCVPDYEKDLSNARFIVKLANTSNYAKLWIRNHDVSGLNESELTLVK